MCYVKVELEDYVNNKDEVWSKIKHGVAAIVVLGMIVDNSIVVIDGYIELLGKGYSRWYAAAESAMSPPPSRPA